MPSHFLLSIYGLLAIAGLAGCATNRQIVIDYPKTEVSVLRALPGMTTVNPDDYYLQWVSEFEFKGENALKAGCSDVGASYETGDMSAALLFKVHNDAIRLQREASGFLYQSASGKCQYKLETKKVHLTPWLRLDTAKDTVVEYRFLTSDSRETNLSQVVGDINAAGNLMALTGVGTGIAVMGKLAGSLVEQSVVQPAANQTVHSAKLSSETHSLANSIVLSSDAAQLNQSRLPVYEVVDAGLKTWASETRLLGEMRIFAQLMTSLLLKAPPDAVPDARDSSLAELLKTPIQTSGGEMPLQQLIARVDEADKPDLQPNWSRYDEVENQCRRLKMVLKDLGFNKFDRNALLFYFLGQSSIWRNHNITASKAMADAIRPRILERYRDQDFSACLTEEDYAAMKRMKLSVNTLQDWDDLLNKRNKKEELISPVQSLGRQLLAALANPDKDEMAKQLYPLFFNDKAGNGQFVLQNHLGNFGLENWLQIPVIAEDGQLISSVQLAEVIHALNVEAFSCVRPALEQGQPLANIGQFLFAGKPGSPREQGGAFEFEVSQGKIIRLAFQHPTFRDFQQGLADYPDLAGCRIEADFLNKLH